jgi:DNA-binding HxlR family transcriptional regulator
LIVRDLASGPRRFVELQRVLPGISTEQLRSRLNRMVADGMLTRKRYREVPPRVDYELTERARELMPILGELARWGYEWAWSPPRASESVDLGAIFRLAPGLLGGTATAATVEFEVLDPDGRSFYTFALSDQGAKLQERQADGAAARVTASTADWIRAFSPERDRSGLQVTGDHQLAETLLDGLVAAGSRAAGRARAAA